MTGIEGRATEQGKTVGSSTLTAALFAQYIALHKNSRDPYIQERVLYCRERLNEIDQERTVRLLEEFLDGGSKP